MQKRQLGSGGPTVSAIGIGAMSFTDFYGATTEAESHAVSDEAMALGIDHLDTSNVYGMGRSEQVIGNFFAKRGPEVRDHFRIATKAGINRDPDSGRPYFDNSPDHLASELDASLAGLGSLSITATDTWQRHRNGTPALQECSRESGQSG